MRSSAVCSPAGRRAVLSIRCERLSRVAAAVAAHLPACLPARASPPQTAALLERVEREMVEGSDDESEEVGDGDGADSGSDDGGGDLYGSDAWPQLDSDAGGAGGEGYTAAGGGDGDGAVGQTRGREPSRAVPSTPGQLTPTGSGGGGISGGRMRSTRRTRSRSRASRAVSTVLRGTTASASAVAAVMVAARQADRAPPESPISAGDN